MSKSLFIEHLRRTMTRGYDLIKNAPNFLEHTGFLTLRSFISVVMDFASIAETVSASQDEEVWVEIQSYRDSEHLDEFMANMRKIRVVANPFTSSIYLPSLPDLVLLWRIYSSQELASETRLSYFNRRESINGKSM